MSTTNFTPGPWYATGKHVQSARLNEDNYVCEAEGNSTEQAQANARLIAAAPELLRIAHEAQEALDVLADYMADTSPARTAAATELAMNIRGIIAKATTTKGDAK